MKFFNGRAGTVGKVSAAVGMVAAILVLYWQLSDRVHAVADTAKKDAIVVAKAEDAKIITAMTEDQQRNSTRFWMQQLKLAEIELRRIVRGLRHHPNDPDLLEEKDYWKEIKDQAKQALNKLLNP